MDDCHVHSYREGSGNLHWQLKVDQPTGAESSSPGKWVLLFTYPPSHLPICLCLVWCWWSIDKEPGLRFKAGKSGHCVDYRIRRDLPKWLSTAFDNNRTTAPVPFIVPGQRWGCPGQVRGWQRCRRCRRCYSVRRQPRLLEETQSNPQNRQGATHPRMPLKF